MSILFPLLLVLVAVILLIALTADRAAAGLAPETGDQLYVDAYVSHTRRWRIAGAVVGGLVGVASALPQERISIGLFPVLAGWFAGAVIAEFRFRAPLNAGREAVVPGRLLRVPLFLAVGTAGVTVLVFALSRSDVSRSAVSQSGVTGSSVSGSGLSGSAMSWSDVSWSGGLWWWCAGGLAVAAAMAAANRRVLSRPVLAASAVGAIAGVGSAVVAWCLAGQLSLLGSRSFDAAVTGIGLVWVIGGLLVARLPATGAAGRVKAVAAVVVVASAGWAGFAWWHGHPPYPASAVRATATVRLTDDAHFLRDAGELGITQFGVLLAQPRSRTFIGRVDHAVPAGADRRGRFRVLVIDKRQNRVAPQMYGPDGGGWDGSMSELAERYPWLSATADIRMGGGYRSAGLAASAAADVRDPIVFVGQFPEAAGLSAADLMVVLVFSGPDQQIYWASRVSG